MDRSTNHEKSNPGVTDGGKELAITPASGNEKSRPLRDRLRSRIGVSTTTWHLGVSIVLVLPYLLFLYLFSIPHPYELEVTLLALGYSLVAMYVGYKL
jgi:hypothetical protein